MYVCVSLALSTIASLASQIICQIPATVTSKLYSPRIWIGCAAIGWGLSSTLMSTGFNFAGLLVCRVSLGIFEAAFGPGSTSSHLAYSNYSPR